MQILNILPVSFSVCNEKKRQENTTIADANYILHVTSQRQCSPVQKHIKMVFRQCAGSERSEMSHETHAYKCTHLVFRFALCSYYLLSFFLPFFLFSSPSQFSLFLFGLVFRIFWKWKPNFDLFTVNFEVNTVPHINASQMRVNSHFKYVFLFTVVLVPYSLLVLSSTFWLQISTLNLILSKYA